MADNKESIALEVKIETAESAKTLKELKNALKELINEQANVSAGSKEFKKLSNAINDTEGKIGDLNDGFRTLTGSGIDRTRSSLGLLKEGFSNFDLGKIGTSLKGLGAAFKAVPIFLMVEGITYLYQNFKELSTGSGLLAKVLQGVGDVIGYCTDKLAEFTDWIGITNSALDEMGDAIKKNADKAKEAIAEQTSEYDRQIAIAKASGKSAVNLEIAKQEAIVRTNKAIVDQILAYQKAGGELTDEQMRIFNESINAIKNAKNQENVIELTAQKTISDNQKKEYEKRATEHKAHLDELRKQWLDYQLNRDYDQAVYEEKNRAFQAQVKAAEQVEIDNKRAQEQIDRDNADIALHDKAQKEKEAAEVSKKLEQDKANATLQIAQVSNQSMQQLSDAFFYFKMKNMKKGSAEELKAAEQQFKINKALAITSAVISGIQGVVNALSAQSVIPEPFGTVLKVVTAVGIGAAAAVNVAKIASTKFNPGSSSAPSGGGAPSVPIPAPPSISTQANNINKGTTFDENGKNTSIEKTMNPSINVNVKAHVVESEMTDKQKDVAKIKEQSTF